MGKEENDSKRIKIANIFSDGYFDFSIIDDDFNESEESFPLSSYYYDVVSFIVYKYDCGERISKCISAVQKFVYKTWYIFNFFHFLNDIEREKMLKIEHDNYEELVNFIEDSRIIAFTYEITELLKYAVEKKVKERNNEKEIQDCFCKVVDKCYHYQHVFDIFEYLLSLYDVGLEEAFNNFGGCVAIGFFRFNYKKEIYLSLSGSGKDYVDNSLPIPNWSYPNKTRKKYDKAIELINNSGLFTNYKIIECHLNKRVQRFVRLYRGDVSKLSFYDLPNGIMLSRPTFLEKDIRTIKKTDLKPYYSCCEGKILSYLTKCDEKKCIVFITKKPCWLCRPVVKRDNYACKNLYTFKNKKEYGLTS